MSLMSTLTKMAVGVAVAKGASALMSGGGDSQEGGIGALLGGLGAGDGAGLQEMLGGLMGGESEGLGEGLSAGLGGLLENLGGEGESAAQEGGALAGMGGLLGGLAGAGGAAGLIGVLSGAMSKGGGHETAGIPQAQTQREPVLNPAFTQVAGSGTDSGPDSQEAMAALMLKAMIQAAKSDGSMDEDERQKVIGHLGNDLDEEEAAFIQSQIEAPVDIAALVSQVPAGKEEQIYGISLLAINLDSQAEARYLHELAGGLSLEAAAVNEIHSRMGVAPLYS